MAGKSVGQYLANELRKAEVMVSDSMGGLSEIIANLDSDDGPDLAAVMAQLGIVAGKLDTIANFAQSMIDEDGDDG